MKTHSTKFSWFIPIDGDGYHAGTEFPEREPSFEYLSQVVKTAEKHNFYSFPLWGKVRMGGEKAYSSQYQEIVQLSKLQLLSKLQILPNFEGLSSSTPTSASRSQISNRFLLAYKSSVTSP